MLCSYSRIGVAVVLYVLPLVTFESNAAPAKAEKVFIKSMDTADLAESIELLEKAIDMHPNYIEAHHNLAVHLSRLGDFDAAFRHFENALELDPSSAMAWANLGVTLDATGDVAAAETAARQAIVLEPRSEFASYLLGSLLLRAEKNLPYAAELLGNAADQFPVAGLLQIDALLASGDMLPARHALQSLVVASASGVQ
jgi:tetratricopeptide (TPR) repeat protein